MKNLTFAYTLLVFLLLPLAAQSQSRMIHAEWEPSTGVGIAGYRLYLDGTPVCDTSDPLAASIDCSVSAEDGESTFYLTSYAADGAESAPSQVYTYIFSENLKALFTADILSGASPLTVTFDAGASTGNILQYSWQFGDGENGSGSTVTHTFQNEGSYVVELEVVDDLGAVDRESITVAVSSPTTENTPPTAVMSMSASLGEAPLAVQFDGSESSDSDGTIVQHHWDMGDGTTSTGSQSSHTYTTAGTYTATLTVTDDGGMTDSVSTPVVVSQPQSKNIPPTAVITADISEGAASLGVIFDGSDSHDADGFIVSYDWSFGDGSTASRVSPSHTFTEPATYTVTLIVTDDAGDTASTTTTINVLSDAPETLIPVEAGEILVGTTWHHIEIIGEFVDPVVIAGPLSYNGNDPAITRIRNVGPQGFDIRIQEWDYLDGTHGDEMIHYLVMEKGNYTLANGLQVEAGSFSAQDQKFQQREFMAPFQVDPIVLTSVATYNGGDAITTRLRRIKQQSFECKLSEQESKRKTGHVQETVGYIALEPGIGVFGDIEYEIGSTPNAVTDGWYQIGLQSSNSAAPYFFAAMQSTDGGDTSSLRYDSLNLGNVLVFVEEETSKDKEVKHTTEKVGYLVLRQKEQ